MAQRISTNLNQIKILIIEDNPSQTSIMRLGLEKCGFLEDNIVPSYENDESFSTKVSQLSCAKNYDKLVDFILEDVEQNKIDLLILDLQLCTKGDGEQAGSTSGEKLIEKFMLNDKQILKTLPIMISSQYSVDEISKGPARLRPFVHLHKPQAGFDAETFQDMIEDEQLHIWAKELVATYREIRESNQVNKELINDVVQAVNNYNELEGQIKQILAVGARTILKSELQEWINDLKEIGGTESYPEIISILKDELSRQSDKIENKDLTNILIATSVKVKSKMPGNLELHEYAELVGKFLSKWVQ